MRQRALIVSLFVAGLSSVAGRTPGQIPEQFTNLHVLPKDVSRATLVPIMRQFCLDLNIRCQQCHVGEGDDLSTFNFASDDRPDKKTARLMMTMLRAINAEYLKDVGTPSTAPKVTCYTCHRGALKPLTVAPARGGDRDR
jgi:hypothetical protein